MSSGDTPGVHRRGLQPGAVQRYCHIPLPDWRYVPGRGPHPRQRAEPHLPPLPAPAPGAAAFDEHTWQESIALPLQQGLAAVWFDFHGTDRFMSAKDSAEDSSPAASK